MGRCSTIKSAAYIGCAQSEGSRSGGETIGVAAYDSFGKSLYILTLSNDDKHIVVVNIVIMM